MSLNIVWFGSRIATALKQLPGNMGSEMHTPAAKSPSCQSVAHMISVPAATSESNACRVVPGPNSK